MLGRKQSKHTSINLHSHLCLLSQTPTLQVSNYTSGTVSKCEPKMFPWAEKARCFGFFSYGNTHSTTMYVYIFLKIQPNDGNSVAHLCNHNRDVAIIRKLRVLAILNYWFPNLSCIRLLNFNSQMLAIMTSDKLAFASRCDP